MAFHLTGNQIAFLVLIVVSLFRVHESKFNYCSSSDRYRTLDGSCNNLDHPTWGKANTVQKRFEDFNGPMVDYADDLNLPRGYNSYLPSARDVTNVLMDDSKERNDQHDKFRSGINMAWGQLLAHDIIETQLHSGTNCCNKSEKNRHNLDICFPIHVSKNDKRFPPGCKSFNRAVRATNGYHLPEYREQTNMISSYVDATVLYGTSKEQLKRMRVPNSFLMKVDKGDLLPTIDGGTCLKLSSDDRCPIAGDSRVDEAPNLGLLHILFVREHNYIAKNLHILNPQWDNEQVFQEARRIIIAITQHISYNSYLPTIIDINAMEKYGLFSKKNGFDNVYNEKVDASTRNSMGFALRFGHSGIMPTESILHGDFQTLEDNKIEDTLQSPNLWQTQCGKNIPGLARWLATKPAMQYDIFFVGGIRNKLFFKTNAHGLDLPALNVQRGRDHGSPSYNRWREFCGFSKFKSFRQFGKHGWKLASIYKSVDDVDLFVGGLLEKGRSGRVGPTFECIIGRQFELFKKGDRFWYERDVPPIAFTNAQLNSIKQMAVLSRIYCRNFGLKYIQRDIFSLPMKGNLIAPCDDLPEIDLTLWKEEIDPFVEY